MPSPPQETTPRNTSDSPATAVTIGNFDGVHVGHAALVKAARQAVGPEGSVVVLAFDPHPASVLRPGTEPARLTTFENRSQTLVALGADTVERLEPTGGLLGMTPEDFIADVVQRHRPGFFVEGPDFHFGKGRAGNPETLRRLAAKHRFEAITVPPMPVALLDQSVVTASSTLARWLLENGRVRDAALMLGRPFTLTGTVVQGDRRGRTIGFPTANLAPDVLVPGPGVYAAIATVNGTRSYAAAVNIGTRPTFAGDTTRVEAHLLDTEDLTQPAPETVDGWAPLPGVPEYGWPLELELVSRVRDETRFDSIEALKEQIERDVQSVRQRIGPIGPGRHQHLESTNA
ncbi:MAG: riboflavin kinase/FMN adenylyltransferase [Phycisphaerales bacterium]|jgi:riboflavin kinase/FMN adenylyltransferase